MIKKITLSLFLVLGPFLYLTKAQTFRFTDSRGIPVEGIVVSVKSLDLENGSVLITDNKGTVETDKSFPLIIRTYHFAFLTIQDTIYNKVEVKNYGVQSNNVNLDEISVTGNYSTTDRSVYQTQVITRQEIDAQAANNVLDLFTHQLNVRVNNDQATGSSISLQGIGDENIKVLVDGVPVIGRLSGNINLSQLNLNNVERVEVIRGPASVLYGTNALGGVINIITDASSNPPFKAGVNTYYETNGQYNVDAYTNFHFRKTDISVSGGRYFFDGWSDKESGRADEWNPKEQKFGSLRFAQKIKKTKLVFQSSFFDEKVTNLSGDIRGLPYQAYVFDEYFKTKRFNNEVQISHLFNAEKNLQVSAAYSFYRYDRNTYRKNLVTLNEALSNDVLQQDTNDFGAAMVRAVYTKDDLNSKWNYQVGLDLNNEYTTGRRIEDHKQDNGDYAAFASVEYRPFENFLIRPAVRYAYNTVYKAPVVPSLQFMYELKQKTVLRASYSRGFRSPSLKEMYLHFVDANHNVYGNTDLKAEESDHILFSVDRTFPIGKTKLVISPSGFYNHIKNKIDLLSVTGDLYKYVNFYEYITKGGQLSASMEYKAFELSTGLSYTGIYNSEIVDGDFLYSTELNTMAQYKINKTKTLIALYWKYNGSQPQYYLAENTDDFTVFQGESYSMVDASVTQKFMKDRITIGAGIKNMLDVTTIKNKETAGAHQAGNDEVFTGMGRSYFVRLQYQFRK
ncbi:MAG: TonB-dependent receptor [Bacteroidota bacterium]